jgi:hypothetical protein
MIMQMGLVLMEKDVFKSSARIKFEKGKKTEYMT